VKSTVAGKAHHRVTRDGGGQQEEAEEIATPHNLFEQSTF
jgi:hypothetical protein